MKRKKICALPQVKAGSVIEVSYTVKSDFLYNLQSWQFQHTIPTLFTEYHLTVSEYFQKTTTMTFTDFLKLLMKATTKRL